MRVVRFRFNVHERASFLGDSVFAASDGVVTTFAIVAGSTGASLPAGVVVILGFANLFADGISMAAGNYLGVKSEMEYEESKGDVEDKGSPVLHGLVTFISFSVSGLIPLIPYILNIEPKFSLSILLVALALFMVGTTRGLITKNKWWKDGIEMLFIGGIAAVAAFMAGFLFDKYVVV